MSPGRVTLEGTVANWAQSTDAERAVERLTGVESVANRIEVSPGEPLDAGDVHRAVENALEREAAREASQIDVNVSDGTVEVAGPVRSWQDKQAVLRAVRLIRGVRDVADHLRIVPSP